MKTVIDFARKPAVRIVKKVKERRPLRPKYRWYWGSMTSGKPAHWVIAYTKSEARALLKRDVHLEPGDVIQRGEAVPQTREVAK